MAKKKTEEEILFPEQEVAGITVKPWSFGDLFKIADPLDRILDKIIAQGLDQKLLSDEGGIQLDYFSLARLFTLASKELLSVISDTLNVEPETVEKLSASDGIAIVLLMFNQNKEMLINSIKNALSSPPKSKLEKAVKKKTEREQTKTKTTE